MKKKIKLLYCVIFFIICFIPLLVFPFIKNEQNIEKKKDADKPELIIDNRINTDYSSDATEWINERLPFRSYILTAANYLKSSILKSDSANVIQGKDGWLFYEETAKDYLNSNEMTDRELSSIAVTLSLLQENVDEKGGRFVFVPIPNKNSVYGEYMPDWYIKSDVSNLSRLGTYLDEYNINYVDMKNILSEKKDSMLYHKRDTHWNYLGALIGYNSIMDGLSREHKTYDGVDYVKEKKWHGDLDKMLYPEGNTLDYQYTFDIDYDEFKFTIPAGVSDTKALLDNYMSDKEENDNRFRTSKVSPQNGLKLYMVRDSFGRALLPYMIDNYDQAMFVRTKCPEMTMVGPDTDMVYEIVERNLKDIISTAPFMMAPLRDIDCDKAIDAECSVHFADEAYGLRIYGTIDDAMLCGDSRIYVKIYNEDNSYVYEAFPIYEAKLLDDIQDNSNGYSLILNKKNIEDGQYSVSIITGDKICKDINQIDIKAFW